MRWLLVVLVAFIVYAAPWRIMGLVAETLVMKPGPLRASQTTDSYWETLQLEARLISMGWEVSYEKDRNYMGRAAYGLTNMRTHHIYVDAALSWDARYAVLAHEAGHVLQPGWLDEAQPDVFAEMVSLLVVKDGIREHARYLAGHKVDTLVVALAEWPAAYHAAAVLLDQ